MESRKYIYFDYIFPNSSIWAGFLLPPTFPFCLYYENKRFYEFFTGKEMVSYSEPYVIKAGIRVGDSGHHFYMMFKDAPLDKVLIGTSPPLSRIISAAEFAEKVRPLMKHKKRILASMEAYLVKSRAMERRKQEQKRLQQAQKEQEKNNAENWLDSVIKGNK